MKYQCDASPNQHICLPQYAQMNMHEFYRAIAAIPTSDYANVALIRSHIAYHAGQKMAERALIKPSRGHSYRVSLHGRNDDWKIVKIIDHYDHRDGVTGLFSAN